MDLAALKDKVSDAEIALKYGNRGEVFHRYDNKLSIDFVKKNIKAAVLDT